MIWMEFLQVNNCSVLTAPIAIIAPLRKLLNLRNWTVFFIHVVVNGVICSIVQVIWTSVCNNAQSLLSAIIFRNKRFMLILKCYPAKCFKICLIFWSISNWFFCFENRLFAFEADWLMSEAFLKKFHFFGHFNSLWLIGKRMDVKKKSSICNWLFNVWYANMLIYISVPSLFPIEKKPAAYYIFLTYVKVCQILYVCIGEKSRS